MFIELIQYIIIQNSKPKPVEKHKVVHSQQFDIFDTLSKCESGGNPDAISPDGRYFGAFQFDLTTWHGLGMIGVPTDYSYNEQKVVAKKLYSISGWGAWPVCASSF